MRHPQLVHSQNPVRVTPLQLHSHITILLQFKPTPGTYQRSCMLVYDGIWQIIFQDQNFPRRSLNQCYGPQLDYGVKHGFRSCFLALLIILVINQLPVFAVIDMLPQCFPYLFSAWRLQWQAVWVDRLHITLLSLAMHTTLPVPIHQQAQPIAVRKYRKASV